jgi:hypothetical protein
MKRMMRLLLAAGALYAAGGCAYVTSSQPSMTNVTGEAWYTEAIGFFGLFWDSHVYYCPAATSAGPVTCKEAKLVPAEKK